MAQRFNWVPRFWLILLFAALHFGLLVTALYNGLVIWSGPTTAWEIFWSHALEVLLFPLDLFPWPPMSTRVQTVFFGFNSIVWGTVLAFLFTWVRHTRNRRRRK
jgi:hypothetical protein